MTDLEKELAKLRFKEVPAGLRRQVLAVCAEKEDEVRDSVPFWKMFYPGHNLTAALACVWLVILLLHWDTPEFKTPAGPAISWAQWQQAKTERDLLLARLEAPRFEVDLNKGSFSIPQDELKSN